MDHASHNKNHKMAASESSIIEYLKFAGIICFIIIATILAHSGTDSVTIADFLRYFMGIFMIVFASFKLLGYKMFVTMFAGYDIIAKKYKAYSYAYPFIELSLGLMALADAGFPYRNFAVIFFMGVGAIGVFKEIYHRRSGIHCACLGNIIKLPLSTVSLVEDLGMVALATTLLIIS